MSTQILHEESVDLVGRQNDDPKIQQFLSRFNVAWDDVKVSDADIKNRSKEFKELGFSVNFEDIGQLKTIDFHDIGDGSYILEAITFWGHGSNFPGRAAFPIAGLSFESSIEEVIAVLGPPSKRPEEATRPVQWMYEGYKIVIHWMQGPRKIRNITYWLTDLDEKAKNLK